MEITGAEWATRFARVKGARAGPAANVLPSVDQDDCEVIIVGAGPTGLLAAALLVRCGVRVRIFDQNPEQAHESRALGVQARTLELFLSLGLAERMLERGTLVTSGRLFVDGEIKAELHLDDIRRTDTPYPFVLIVPQRETEAILNDEMRRFGVEVERSVAVTGLEQTPGGVSVAARRGDGSEFTVRAAYVLGADGAHSMVRKTLDLSFEGAAYPQDFLLADCRVEGLPAADGLAIFLHGKSFAVYLPLSGGEKMGRIITIRPGQGDKGESVEKQGGTDAPLAEVQEAFRAATQMPVTLSESIWTSLYRVHHRGVDRYRVGRVFVAGDAAHIHSPAAGQGMNTGLQDAANLAWKLVLALRGSGPASEALLDTYHAERWPVGQRVLKYTDEMFTAATSQSGWFATLRNAVMPRVAGVLAHTDFFRERAFHFISELGIRYEKNAGLLDETGHGPAHFWKGGPACGHRAPNAAYARNQDVFGLLTGYQFHVLVLSRRPLSAADVAHCLDLLAALPKPSGLDLVAHIVACSNGGPEARFVRAESLGVFAAYGVDHETPQAIYLVRPDGYIAWRCAGLEFSSLGEFLRTHFVGHESGT